MNSTLWFLQKLYVVDSWHSQEEQRFGFCAECCVSSSSSQGPGEEAFEGRIEPQQLRPEQAGNQNRWGARVLRGPHLACTFSISVYRENIHTENIWRRLIVWKLRAICPTWSHANFYLCNFLLYSQ